MEPDQLSEEMRNNWSLLCGEVAGALMGHFPTARFEGTSRGDMTGRTLIDRPSGVWAVSVELVEENE